MEQKIRLEPIQEESEKEDGIKEGKTGEGQETHFQSKVGLKTEVVVAEDESNEEDEGALRSRQLSRSLRQKSFLQMQSTVSEWKEMKHFIVPDSTPYSLDLSDEATSPRPPSLEKVWWCSGGKQRRMISKNRQQQFKALQRPVQKKREKPKKEFVVEQFPQWLVDLMVNIEEATTHQLVVE